MMGAPSRPLRGGLLAGAAVLAAGVSAARPAETAPASQPASRPAAEARCLELRAVRHDAHTLSVRAALEIAGPPHRWYDVVFGLCLDRSVPFRRRGGQPFDVDWGQLFTPANIANPRWTDCRVGLRLDELTEAGELPAGKRTIVWAVCRLFSYAEKRFLCDGWDARTPLILTTDAAGRIERVEFFHTEPFVTAADHPTARIKALAGRFRLEHLRCREGVEVDRAVRRSGEVCDIIRLGGRQADLRGGARGWFFGPIGSADQAGELIRLGYPGAVIIEQRQQFGRIVSALKAIGWKADHMPLPEPDCVGLTIAPEAPLGYRAAALMVDCAGSPPLLGSVVLRRFTVGQDGRIGVEEHTCIRGPAVRVRSAAAGGQLPAGAKEYDAAVRAALKIGAVPETIATTVVLGDTIRWIPCALGEDARGWLDPAGGAAQPRGVRE